MDVTTTVLVIVLITGKTVNGTVDNTSTMIHSLTKVFAPAVLVTDSDTPVYFLIWKNSDMSCLHGNYTTELVEGESVSYSAGKGRTEELEKTAETSEVPPVK